ncbi:unnamed protein product [Caenorhabditis brenneri]
MSSVLPKLTVEDLQVTYSRKRKLSSSSTTSCSSSPSSTSPSTSCSDSVAPKKKNQPAAPEDFLLKKRTMPLRFCPKQRTPTSQYHPKNAKGSQAPRIPYVPRPLQHIPRRPLEDNKTMQQYRAFRQLEMEKAQAAKANGDYEEPPTKKRTQAKRKEFWEKLKKEEKAEEKYPDWEFDPVKEAEQIFETEEFTEEQNNEEEARITAGVEKVLAKSKEALSNELAEFISELNSKKVRGADKSASNTDKVKNEKVAGHDDSEEDDDVFEEEEDREIAELECDDEKFSRKCPSIRCISTSRIEIPGSEDNGSQLGDVADDRKMIESNL